MIITSIAKSLSDRIALNMNSSWLSGTPFSSASPLLLSPRFVTLTVNLVLSNSSSPSIDTTRYIVIVLLAGISTSVAIVPSSVSKCLPQAGCAV